jgi:hypothetical protein
VKETERAIYPTVELEKGKIVDEKTGEIKDETRPISETP